LALHNVGLTAEGAAFSEEESHTGGGEMTGIKLHRGTCYIGFCTLRHMKMDLKKKKKKTADGLEWAQHVSSEKLPWSRMGPACLLREIADDLRWAQGHSLVKLPLFLSDTTDDHE
jgi:hypothetical protein